MKNFFLFIFLFSVGNTLLSQQGKATYSVKTSLGDDFKLNSRIPKQVAERIKKGMSEPILFELFFLSFDIKVSIFFKSFFLKNFFILDGNFSLLI